ncbi:MAG: hypothetical protein IKJ01_08940 [Lachnospiraceae bacterium]|nr:hypothetical protein [Lachnospiraceae bacterium]
MANRRMFSKRITESTKFVKMPATSQNLYFHLCINADDDGIVEAYPVMCITKATEDDLRVLASKGFVKILNEDLITYIIDWREHNNVRADRKIDSMYKDLLLEVCPEVVVIEAKESYYSKKKKEISPINEEQEDVFCQTRDSQQENICQTNDRQEKIFCQTNDGQMTDNTCQNEGIGKVRLGKVRLGKDNIQDTSYLCHFPTSENDEPNQNLEKNESETVINEPKVSTSTMHYVVNLYNSVCKSYPKVTKLSDARKKAIKARLKQYTEEDFKTLFELAEQSSFLKGSNGNNWSICIHSMQHFLYPFVIIFCGIAFR